jgi:hypothetical protein
VLKPVSRIFLALGKVIGTVNTYIILTFVFFFLITPIGLIKRLFFHDPLKTLRKGSCWIKREHDETLERQF